MANWNLPTVNSDYLGFVSEMNAKFVDAITLAFGAPTNLPVNAIRFNRSTNIFEEWDLATWQPKVLGIAGGGTGANNAAGIRTNLGIGSMGTQNSNAVAITGGSITGVNYSANDITSGVLALSRGGTGSSLALGPVGSVLLSNGVQVRFDTGIAISQLDASNLIAGIIPAARLPGTVPQTNIENTWTGRQNFSGLVNFTGAGASSPQVVADLPTFNFYDLDQPANQHYIRIATQAGGFFIQRMDDAYNFVESLAIFQTDGLHLGDSNQRVIFANGSGLTNLNASAIASGIVAPQYLGVGSPSSGTFLRGDGTWAPVSGGGETNPVPAGLIALFDTACPAGWTRVAALDNRFPLGSTGYGAVGGGSSHKHHFDKNTSNAGGHGHTFAGNAQQNLNVQGQTGPADSWLFTNDTTGAQTYTPNGHKHSVDIPIAINAPFSGNTSTVGDHAHNVVGDTDDVNHMPPYITVVYCRKN